MAASYKRSRFCFFSIEKDTLLDMRAFLRGKYETTDATQIFAHSPLTRSRYRISLDDLGLLAQIPVDQWAPEEDLIALGADPARLEKLARQGVLLSDASDSLLSRLRFRGECLEAEAWHPYAALFHFMTRGPDSQWVEGLFVDYPTLEKSAAEKAEQYVARHGPPPPTFHRISDDSSIDLPLVEKNNYFYEVLRKRKTTRAFDPDRRMSMADFAAILHYVFGCHGYTRLSPNVPVLHRTSPSGGARHPIEVYPLVLRVDGVASGIYHYDVQNHALEVIRSFDLERAQTLAVDLCNGQTYAESAHVLLIMTARYYCNYWKYRNVSRSYGVILMDAAHLSQTFYLVAAELGLGAVFSAELNVPHIEEVLGLDGSEEGPLGICACGVRPATGADHGLPFEPFVPRKTTW